MTAESYSWLHATIEQSNVSVEELIYLGLTRVSGAWLDKAVWTRQVRQGRPWWRDIYGVWATLKYIRYLLTARHGLVYSKYMHLIYIWFYPPLSTHIFAHFCWCRRTPYLYEHIVVFEPLIIRRSTWMDDGILWPGASRVLVETSFTLTEPNFNFLRSRPSMIASGREPTSHGKSFACLFQQCVCAHDLSPYVLLGYITPPTRIATSSPSPFN